ncbi:M3 family oligoendopeptidase [Haliangium ochraceum]|uniref:Oligoendopeptidase, pepF/M3 family n=1 Tax=Haliangium ochraceum (strain DSM 14365 / JCM 11303 / SMP-2) TaxID=502025 RepID=D0LUK5_HALO1|nr:M3 family oligoendopeptidase [Haliangium ochraceum]ACY19328.1 oligoendopeptidase, pepF/M3 family [Haliangium ochraceum DSM 14365]
MNQPSDAAEVPRPNWDMRPYFTSPAGPDYAAFWDMLRTSVAELGHALDALPALSEDSAAQDAWSATLLELEGVHARMRHLESYLDCMASADAHDEVIRADVGQFASLQASFAALGVRLRAALGHADDGAVAALLERPELSAAEHWLRRTRDSARESMSPALEELATELGVDGIAAWGRLYDQLSGTLSFSLEVPGRAAEEHPVSMARTLLEDPDPAVRQAALVGSNAAWARVSEPVAACLNAIAGTRLTLYRRRGVGHYLDPALFDAAITRRTLDAMMSAVRGRRARMQRYLGIKARLLGRERLGFQDLLAPLPEDAAPRISWDQARERVLAAFGTHYPALREFAADAFAKRWLDHEPRRGKRPGGFCSSSPVIGESRVFMTYHGSMGDLETLAHELGHAFHSWVMRDMRPWARVYPMTLAETASTFAEQLVSEAMLQGGDADPATQRAVLDSRLQKAAVFLLNIPMRFDFECAFYEARQHGEVGVTRLCELMRAAQRDNYGDALDPDALDPWFWASKLHFYITELSFYNFPYTFGYLFSLGIFARTLGQGPEALARYETLLRRTGSASAEQVAREGLGVDLESPDFWNASLDVIEADLGRFEQLSGKGSGS